MTPAPQGGWSYTLLLYLAQFLSWGGMFMLWVFALPHVRVALDVDEAEAIRWVGMGLALYVALGALLNFALPRAYALFGKSGWHTMALIGGGAGLLTISAAHTPVMLLLGYAITSVGWSSLSSTPYALVNDRVTDGRYDKAMARFNLSVVVPQIIIALALGWLVAHMAPIDAVRLGAYAMWGGALMMAILTWLVRRS